MAELRGRRIRVRPGSSYVATLERLRAKGAGFTLELARSDEETEQLIAGVAAGEVDLTVADSHIFQAERVWRTDVVAAFALDDGEKKQIAFAVRPGDRELKAALDRFVQQSYKGLEYNMSWRRYFEDSKIATESAGPGRRARSRASPRCDGVFRKYAQLYGFDWRLLAAQSYQESRFDPQAKSLAGAVGLFQVLPRTARELGFQRLEDPEEGAHAGIKFLAPLSDRLETDAAGPAADALRPGGLQLRLGPPRRRAAAGPDPAARPGQVVQERRAGHAPAPAGRPTTRMPDTATCAGRSRSGTSRRSRPGTRTT